MSRRVRVTIDELVLGGVAPGEHESVVAGLGQALSTRLAEPGALPAESRRVPRVDVGPPAPASTPGVTGARMADALVKGLAR